jgi:hypothetical protein
MTTATDITSTDEPGRVLSARTLRTYAADWALFTDWCAATDTTALPADPRVVVEFLTGCPAALASQRCRVAAIDHHHTAHGVIGHGTWQVLVDLFGMSGRLIWPFGV